MSCFIYEANYNISVKGLSWNNITTPETLSEFCFALLGTDFYSDVISVGDLLLFRVLWIESDLIHELIMLFLDFELFWICLTFRICIHPYIECGFSFKQSISTFGYILYLLTLLDSILIE